jgi:Tol biopolymer transport system component
MGDLDDRLRRQLSQSSRSVGTQGVLDRLTRRHRSRQLRTKIGVSLLSLSLAGSALTGVYLSRGEPDPIAGGGGGGVIVFSRTLRDCSPGVVPSKPPQLFAVLLDGSAEWNLSRALDLPAGPRFPLNLRGSSVNEFAFSPDGSKLAWWPPTRVDPSGIEVLDLASGSRHLVGIGDRITSISDLTFSPDGGTIAFMAIALPKGQSFSVSEFDMAMWTVPTDGSAPPMRLTTPRGLPTPSYADSTPIWSPDGGTLAFLRAHYSGRGVRPQQALMFVDVDGSNLREIERQPDDATFTVLSGDWSPDGTRFVAEVTFDSFPPTDLFIANIDGRTGYRLTDDRQNDRSGTWSPDGQLIAFQTGRWGRGQGHSEIAITDPSGEEVRRVTDNCWDDQSPVWVSDASYIRSLPPWREADPDIVEPTEDPQVEAVLTRIAAIEADLALIDTSTQEGAARAFSLREQLESLETHLEQLCVEADRQPAGCSTS